MANRDNHYELAFEEYLRWRRVPYVAVDEARRTLCDDAHSADAPAALDDPAGGTAAASIKSLDFIVSAPRGGSWLIDVKGRRFPSGRQKQYWKNWSTRDDLVSLAHWQELFGGGFQAMFVFAYNVVGSRSPLPREQLFEYRDRLYAFLAVRLEDYSLHARPISPRWDTVAMPTGRFRAVAEPLAGLL